MNFDEIINKILNNPGSAFFYTPSFYPKSNSFLFFNPEKVISVYNKNDLNKSLKLVDKNIEKGLTGYCLINYEVGYLLEKRLEKFAPEDELKLMQFFFFKENNVKKIKSSQIDFGKISTELYSVSGFELNTSRKKFFNDIQKIKNYISEGDTYQVNYTVKGKFNFSGSYTSLFKNLIFNQSAEYSSFINNNENIIISLSPELFFRIKRNKITAKPMKGTLSRSKDLKSDAIKEYELLHSEKDRAENLMIVDLLRNDLGRICQYGSVRVNELFRIEKYESLFQMISKVEGKLKKDVSLSAIIKNIFPCGSITGAPKIRTMEIIKEIEDEQRGIYTGVVGMMSKKSSVFNVAIRTVVIDKKSGKGEVGLGSGIVWDSEPAKEYNETLLKSRFLTSPVKPFELIETMLAEDGEIFFMNQHLKRLNKSAQFFLFNFDENEIRKSLSNALKKKYLTGKYKIRLTLNKWGRLNFDYSSLTSLPHAVKIIVSKKSTSSESKFQNFKTTNRELYNSEYKKYYNDGFFDVIFFNEREELAEGSITNIFVKSGDVWLTPQLSCGILPGIYRTHFILSRTDVRESIITLNDLMNANDVILTNSVHGVVKVHKLYYGNEFVEFF
ncbi:MAG: aminodeoxychorismate synthase component I [Bacteroidetes bacterium]|nr:aminodeoxychorismate synthase component I [Bacteroidota bacterium]